ncbi:MAG TPA: polysaccharide deacetylase family protein, partial [Anaerolineales bacterium]|nr:polysaccharide deacetylase family protein [Anaerolineales bacterium]
RGHEVASHGYAHQLIYTQTESEFFADISKTKKILEDLSGEAVLGYRAPGFSITKKTPWALPSLAKAGYKYDSSLFPAKRGHGYYLEAKLYPFKIEDLQLYEFPITVANLFSRRICFFGGGYLRLFPYFLIQNMAKKVADENRPVIYYIHPREIDPNHPRLTMNLSRRFRSYVNLKTTEPKLRNIVRTNHASTFHEFIHENPSYFTSLSTSAL